MRKKILLSLLSFMTVTAAYSFEVGGIYYTTNSDGKTVSVTYRDTDYNSYEGNVTIPAKVNYSGKEYDVTGIDADAFCQCPNLTSVSIPGSVTQILDEAFFECTGLTSVVIPEGVTKLGNFVFCFCENMTEITIPESLKKIGLDVFSTCTSLRTFKGKYATADGRCLILDGKLYCFAGAGMTTYEIPDGVTVIGSDAFSGWEQLTAVNIPGSVKTVDSYAFANCYGLKGIKIPGSVTKIGEYAFMANMSLAEVSISRNIESIGEGAFSECGALKSVTMYSTNPSAIIMEDDVFDAEAIKNATLYVPRGCTKAYDFAPWNGFKSVEEVNTVFSTEHQGTTIYYDFDVDDASAVYVTYASESYGTYSGEVVIPSTVSYEGKTYNVTAVGDKAFYKCTKLHSVELPESVTSIGDYAFWSCTTLPSIALPSSVTTIGEHGFHGCSSLSAITLGENMKSIGALAFAFCPSIETMTVNTADPNDITMGEAVFVNSNTSSSTLYVPKGSVEAYAQADQWKAFDPRIKAIGDSGIEDVVASPANPADAYYDLHGRRVANPSRGLYIQGGRKVIVK